MERNSGSWLRLCPTTLPPTSILHALSYPLSRTNHLRWMNIYYFWWCQTHQQCASHELSVKVLSYEVTCHHDMSLQQKSHTVYMTWWDLMLQHVDVHNELPTKMVSQGRPVIGLFMELSVTWTCHKRGLNVCATFCTTTWICMNSSWFEFIWQVPASNCIKTYMSHEWLVTGMCCDNK